MSRFQVLHDMFTGPDGQTYAIGRVYSVPVLILGLAYPVVELVRGHPWSALELSGYLPALGGATLVFIQGNKTADDPSLPHPLSAQ